MTADLSRAPKWRPGSGGDSSGTGIYFEAGLKGQVCVCLRMGVCVCVYVHVEELTEEISPPVPCDGSTSVDASVSS